MEEIEALAKDLRLMVALDTQPLPGMDRAQPCCQEFTLIVHDFGGSERVDGAMIINTMCPTEDAMFLRLLRLLLALAPAQLPRETTRPCRAVRSFRLPSFS
jgi:hypothetical protein